MDGIGTTQRDSGDCRYGRCREGLRWIVERGIRAEYKGRGFLLSLLILLLHLVRMSIPKTQTAVVRDPPEASSSELIITRSGV